MAHWEREVTLLANKNVANSGVEYVDIDVDQPITEITVKFSGTNHSGAVNPNVNPWRNVTRLSLVDGANVLWSLPGPLPAAAHAFTFGKLPFHLIDEGKSQEQQAHFPIRFGLFVGDEQKAFDPKRFTNPQIKVEWNLAVPNAVGSGGYLTNYGYLAAYARVMEGAPRPSHYIMWKDIESITGGGSGYDYVDLPVDHPYRKIMLHAWKTRTTAPSVISTVKLSKNVEAVVYYDMSTWELVRLMADWYKPVHLFREMVVKNDDQRESYMGVFGKGIIGTSNGAYVHSCDSWDGGSLYHRVIITSSGAAQTSEVYGACNQWGVTPMNCFCLPMGIVDDPSDFLAFLNTDKLRLRLGDAASGSTMTVAIEQLRPL